LRALGEPKRAGLQTIHRASDLTVLHLVWGPRMTLFPHDHRMMAVIGLYGGREDNFFYRRTENGLAQQGEKELQSQDTVILGESVITP
jgi:predicted metal-dependent enzyme (double-stranded beta helix superfamily)